MRAFIIILTAFIIASVSDAFVQPARSFAPRVSTTVFAEEAKKEKKEVVMDTNFDDVNIVRLLGMKRVKKMARKSKRSAEGK